MSLLAFELNGPSPVSDLLTPAQRQKLASELNSALLISQSQEKDPKVSLHLFVLSWREMVQRSLIDQSSMPTYELFIVFFSCHHFSRCVGGLSSNWMSDASTQRSKILRGPSW